MWKPMIATLWIKIAIIEDGTSSGGGDSDLLSMMRSACFCCTGCGILMFLCKSDVVHVNCHMRDTEFWTVLKPRRRHRGDDVFLSKTRSIDFTGA